MQILWKCDCKSTTYKRVGVCPKCKRTPIPSAPYTIVTREQFIAKAEGK